MPDNLPSQGGKARGVTVSAALFALICFFLPWVQVSCLGAKDSSSGLDLARGGECALWLVPLLMGLVLVCGLVRVVWVRLPALFALSGLAGGLVCAWLMFYERGQARPSSSFLATFWTAWYWLGCAATLVLAAAALWFYTQRARSP